LNLGAAIAGPTSVVLNIRPLNFACGSSK
jgi:hypothetical protein